MEDIISLIRKEKEEIIELRRYLHKNAELGFNLPKTVAFIREKLKEYGLNPALIGRASVCATIDVKKERTLLLRADTDAVAIKEESGLDFSANGEAMHACGHDMHTAILLYTAKILKQKEKELNANIKFLFQGAEEILEGASDCIEGGLFNEPKPDCAIGMHILCAFPFDTGTLILPKANVAAPSADFFEIKITGKSAHAASPNGSKDALLVLGELLTSLPLIPRFVTSFASPALISIGMAGGGSSPNVTAEYAELKGSARCFSEEAREKLKKRIVTHTQHLSQAYGVECEVIFKGGAALLKNDKNILNKVKEILTDDPYLHTFDVNAGADERFATVSGGSEDFANIADKVPSVFLALAAGDIRQGYTERLHNSKVIFDEGALEKGVYAFVKIALSL